MTTSIAHGAKHICVKCVTRFYDLRRQPVACPTCGEKVPVLVTPTRPRARRKVGDAVRDTNPLAAHIVVTTDPTPKSKQVKWK
jgi:uncharacterized protein (TIGR02300 family)